MADELATEGVGDDVEFVVINNKSTGGSVSNLVDRCEFPIFQDTLDVGAWTLHGGKKDDMFVFNEGILMHYLPMGGATSITLSSSIGYANVKDAIIEALNTP